MSIPVNAPHTWEERHPLSAQLFLVQLEELLETKLLFSCVAANFAEGGGLLVE